MKVYSLGNKAGPALMLLPGSCCHWKSNFCAGAAAVGAAFSRPVRLLRRL